MIFRSDNPDGELNGFVDAGTRFRGELQFETTFRVEGKVEGTVVSSGNLVIGEGGEVDGEIRVGQLFVSGIVRGTVKASRRIQICAQGRAVRRPRDAVAGDRGRGDLRRPVQHDRSEAEERAKGVPPRQAPARTAPVQKAVSSRWRLRKER